MILSVTEGPGVAVVTYEITLSETIEGQRFTSKASRLSVWQNDNGKWQTIAHASLIPVAPVPSSKRSNMSGDHSLEVSNCANENAL